MTHIKMELNSWLTPTYATLKLPPGHRQDGMKEMVSIPLDALPDDTFHDLVKQWLVEIYDKARKPYNWRFE